MTGQNVIGFPGLQGVTNLSVQREVQLFRTAVMFVREGVAAASVDMPM